MDFLMVIMAGGFACGCIHSTATTELCKTAAILQLIAWQGHTDIHSPGTSRMKARLIKLWCFVLTTLPQRSLILLRRRSGLFISLCLWVTVFLNATRRARNFPPFPSYCVFQMMCGLNRQKHFSLPSIECSAAPPIFRLLSFTVSLSELCSTI